jgi:hypothetical protein
MIAERYTLEQIETTFYTTRKRLGITYRDRVKWLEKEVLQPSERLRKALDPENFHWFSLFPNLKADEERAPSYPHVLALAEELRVLERYTE